MIHAMPTLRSFLSDRAHRALHGPGVDLPMNELRHNETYAGAWENIETHAAYAHNTLRIGTGMCDECVRLIKLKDLAWEREIEMRRPFDERS